ncbi:helix-turn-helix domain-containing protein [Lapillicoccus sp.]|uniref:GlxA family transcriptional regulator n=1 Tax=Lapillicoccus sp. TaxID=1909287 RepID=UPI0025E14A95|nr:helix-turn-helix domain-containing protein [Lapillicoccus sp.]
MHIAILLVDGVADSGMGLLRDVFSAADLLAARIDEHIDPFRVTLHATGNRVTTGYGLTAATDPVTTLSAARPDHLLIPSLGLIDTDELLQAVSSSDVLEDVRALHADGVAVAAACSGTFLLAESGLLAGRVATTSWWLGPTFRARYPDVLLDESRALVVSETVTTAGAALAHIDLALSLVRRVNPWLADAVSDYLAVGDRPQQGDLMRPNLLPTSDPVLVAFDRAVRDRLTGSIDIRLLASDLGVSQRTLQRLTSSVLGTTPVHYVQQIRLERALDLLRTTDLSVRSVAHAVGYRDATTLGTLIRRRRGTTPAQVHRRRSR